FDDLRRGSTGRHRGPLLVAAASFVAVVLGVTWLEHARPTLLARPMTNVAGLVEPASPPPLAPEPAATDAVEPVEPPAASAPVPAPTSGIRDTAVPSPAIVREPPPRPAETRSEPAVVRSMDVASDQRIPATPVVSEATIATDA